MLKITELKVLVNNSDENLLKEKIASKLRIKTDDILEIDILKRSLDARRKPELFYIYQLAFKVANEKKVLSNLPRDMKDKVKKYEPKEYDIYQGKGSNNNRERLKKRPVIIGAGPAGLFAAYELSKYGYNPIVIERGKRIEERKKDVDEFILTNVLKCDSNVQFGEGGAGAFSDGKLNTSVKDPFLRNKEVLDVFYLCGADKEITYDQKPHIGTDVLYEVIPVLRNKIIDFGGEFRFNTCFKELVIKDGRVIGVRFDDNSVLETDTVILCIGHSARDTFLNLYNQGIKMESKSFAVGFRVEHKKKDINLSQYGAYEVKELKSASYKLTSKAQSGRGVYTFCMCPGGYVINASSEEGMLAVNGMSYHDRDGENSNSAVIVSVTPEDFHDNTPLAGMYFQRELEKKAYELGEGLIPQQRYIDFKNNVISKDYGKIISKTKGKCKLTNLRGIFKEEINESFIEGMEDFGRKIKGFNDDDVILSGVESRTSSPIRITRDDLCESNIKGLFPCGEGAGYAGGITSAGMDGIKIAEDIIGRYLPCEER